MPTRSLAELVAQWEARRADLERLHAMVDGAVLIDELLTELREWQAADAKEAVSLQEAHRLGGYSVDHLQRLVAQGKIENVGRRGSPRIRRADVPMRTGYVLPDGAEDGQFSSRRRMALAVTTSKAGEE